MDARSRADVMVPVRIIENAACFAIYTSSSSVSAMTPLRYSQMLRKSTITIKRPYPMLFTW